jgi:hypothetical protein
MRRDRRVSKPEILELPNFEYTPQGVRELKAALKEGNTVRNPFARFYGEKVEVNIIQDTKAEQCSIGSVQQ